MRLVRLLLALVLVALVAAVAAGTTFALKWARELPDYRQLDNLRLQATSRVYARDGRLVGVIVPTVGDKRVDRTPVALSEISPLLIASVVSGEDEAFFRHYGFDPLSLVASVFQTFVKGNQRGGSTLTAQLIRSTILSDEDTLKRKAKELMLSVQVERYFTKEEILGGYLNAVFWGGNLYGVRAAARGYFGKDPIELTLAQSLYISSLLPGPNQIFRDLRRARAGMRLRVERLVKNGWVDRATAEAAWREPIQPRGWRITWDGKGNAKEARLVDARANVVDELTTEIAPHFMYQVRKILNARFKDQLFEGGGLRVYTTLDPRWQRAAEDAVANARVPRGTNAQVSLAAIDPNTGEVRAIVGGRGELGAGQFDRAVMLRRSPGSSIKPLLYALGIEQGLNQWDLFDDKPIRMPDRADPDGYWTPKNFGGALLNRPVQLRYSLDHSLNLPTIRLGEQLGMPLFRDRLIRLGFDDDPRIVDAPLRLTSTIGGGVNVSPLQMASAYATFANGGTWIEPQFIRRIEDAEGNVLYQAEPQRRRVWTPQTAFVALDMLKGVVYDPKPYNGGYADKAKIPGRVIAGKTGTSNNVVDMWFVGLTPQLAAAVWMGREDNQPMPQNAFSGEYNPPVWRDFAAVALQGTPPGRFPTPRGVATRRVDGIDMAYVERDVAAQPAPGEPESRARPQRPSVTGPALPPEPMVTVALDVCNRPLRLADEATPADCVGQRRVRAADLALYDPAYRPPASEAGAVQPDAPGQTVTDAATGPDDPLPGGADGATAGDTGT